MTTESSATTIGQVIVEETIAFMARKAGVSTDVVCAAIEDGDERAAALAKELRSQA